MTEKGNTKRKGRGAGGGSEKERDGEKDYSGRWKHEERRERGIG